MDRNSITIRLDADDVAEARFTVSPAHELVRIVRALRAPHRFPAHRSLMQKIRHTAPASSYRILTEVVTDRGYVPDFLTPLTEDPSAVPELIRTASHDQIITELGELVADGRCNVDAVRRLAHDPVTASLDLANAAESLWTAAIAPLWPAMLQVLQVDIHARTRVLASSGFGAMITGLHPTLAWTGDAIVRSSSIYTEEISAGRGLLLVPTIFGWPNVQTSTDSRRPPTILYPARNATTEWSEAPAKSVERLIGNTRARVLAHLDFPATTSDVAQALGIAISTAHHHLDVLVASRLVDRHREGSAVWHLRTPLGDQLHNR